MGVTALLVGAMCVSVGLGVGLRWVLVGVVTPKSVGAFSVMIGGAVLIGLGLRWLTSGLRGAGRIAAVALTFVVLAVLVWTMTPAVIATNVPPTNHTSDLGLSGREAHFVTADGVDLWGWYIPPSDGKTVVLRHGAGSTASSVRAQAEVLAANGFGVLMTDARGHGSSEGTAMDFGWHGDSDISAAIGYLIQQPEVDPSRIAVVGMSMGGEEAIGAAGSDDRIAAVVAEGATARAEADKAWLVDGYGWRGWLQMRLEWVQYSLADMLTEAKKPDSLVSAAQGSQVPILLITAGKSPDELHAARFIAIGGDNVEIWEVPEADHIQGLAVAPEDWENVVVGFLDESMGGS